MITIVLIGIGLSMDALAVTVANTLCYSNKRGYLLFMSFMFGLFQALMPVIGFFAGSMFLSLIERIDHWMALVLLSLIGINMIVESFKESKEGDISCEIKNISVKMILLQAIATSIDALAVGISLTAVEQNIFISSLIIGSITFVICIIGTFIGNRLGRFIKNKAEVFGGIILILIGIKIFLEDVL